MPQSLSQVYVHVVFSTKDRRPVLTHDLRADVTRVITGTINRHGGRADAIGMVADHVHVLLALARTRSIAEMIQQIKVASSRWVNGLEQSNGEMPFHWQRGYGAFSVSVSSLSAVRRYINTQEQRHEALSFEDEFRGLLVRHKLTWDERYVWD